MILFFPCFVFSLTIMSSAAAPSTSTHSKPSSVSAGTSAGKESHRAPSALMTSIFSPPLTLSQTAMAEAGVAAVAGFSVPPAYDPTFLNFPDCHSVLVHGCASTHKDSGFQAVVVLHPKSDVPAHLGLPGQESEETAFLMVSSKNQPFLAYNQAPKAAVLQVSAAEYLTLLSYAAKEWPRLCSRLLHQTNIMREGVDPVTINSNLAFYSHGLSTFSVALSSNLVLKAKADSRVSKEEERIRVWLEQRVPEKTGENGDSGSSSSSSALRHELLLPMKALGTLAQDALSVKTLTDSVSAYKSRVRKRSRPVT